MKWTKMRSIRDLMPSQVPDEAVSCGVWQSHSASMYMDLQGWELHIDCVDRFKLRLEALAQPVLLATQVW